jgi:hypothetical protein
MPVIHSVLVADGSSDRMLIPILQKLLADLSKNTSFADIMFATVRADSLGERIAQAVTMYPCDIIFVHRDAENQPPDLRYLEINASCSKLSGQRLVSVVPVRMTEAWLLVAPDAILKSVGNKDSNFPLNLPDIKRIESCDAKTLLDAALNTAVNLNSRRRRRFRPEEYRTRVAELLTSVEPLRRLPSFLRLEADLRNALMTLAQTDQA